MICPVEIARDRSALRAVRMGDHCGAWKLTDRADRAFLVERLVSASGFSVPTSGATVQEGPTATKTATKEKIAAGVRSAASNQVANI